MELDEFKKYWNTVQEEELKHQAQNPETINKIIMNTTSTLGELKNKSIFWNKMGGWNSALLVLLALTNIALLFVSGTTFPDFVKKLPLICMLIGFAWFARYSYQWQEQIFTAPGSHSLQETLSSTILNFKRYYKITNLIFLAISPCAFYAVFRLFLHAANLPFYSVILISVGLTGISFLIRLWYYKVVYFKRIKAMQANLRELENV